MRIKVALALVTVLCGGCAFFGASTRRNDPVAGPYAGLAGKSLAIVIYAPAATVHEYPVTQLEISHFIADEVRLHVPIKGLLAPEDVVDWQNSALNWQALPEKEIARHFSVDRVLFVEVLEFSTRKIIGASPLQGRLRCLCKVAETDGENDALGWSGVVDVSWPPNRPLDPTQTNEDPVRYRAMESFAKRLVGYFYQERGTGTP